MADVRFYIDFDLLSTSNKSVIVEGFIGLELELTVDAIDFGMGVGRIIEVFIESIGVDKLPYMGCNFSESVVEVEIDYFVLLAFVALTCQVTLAEDKNIMNADALGNVFLKFSQLIFAEFLGVDLSEDVSQLEID